MDDRTVVVLRPSQFMAWCELTFGYTFEYFAEYEAYQLFNVAP